MRMTGRRLNDPQLVHDLAHERTEVSRTLAGVLAEHHRAGGERLTEDDLLDVEILSTKAAGLIRRLAGALEMVSHPAIARRPGEHLTAWATRFNELVDRASKLDRNEWAMDIDGNPAPVGPIPPDVQTAERPRAVVVVPCGGDPICICGAGCAPKMIAPPLVRERPRDGEPACWSCGDRLIFSARQQGDSLCGLCSRSGLG